MDYDKRAEELNVQLPELSDPCGNFIHSIVDGRMLYLAGKTPNAKGKLGRDFTIEQGYQFARETGLFLLQVIKRELGTLNRVDKFIRVFGMVNCTDDFENHPAVINGCSDLFIDVFGKAGEHVRMAVGANSLPHQVPVEIDACLLIKDNPA